MSTDTRMDRCELQQHEEEKRRSTPVDDREGNGDTEQIESRGVNHDELGGHQQRLDDCPSSPAGGPRGNERGRWISAKSFRMWLYSTPYCHPSLVLENSGSVARDHLASERTFLAYVRTSLACAATGVALMQLISMTQTNVPTRLRSFAKYLGAVIELCGLGIMFIGRMTAVYRYFSMQKALIDGKYPPAGLVIWAVVFAMGIIICVTFGLMLGIALS